MHKNCHKSYLDSKPALHKCRVDKFLEVLKGTFILEKQAQNINMFKALLKKNKSLLNNIDFRKEACIISKKNPQYEYF